MSIDRANIIEVMQRSLWKIAYAVWANAAGLPREAPATPAAVKTAVVDLGKLYAACNGGESLVDMYERWQAAMLDQDDDPDSAKEAGPRHFGHLAAMASLGLMRQALFENLFKVPTFTIEYDGSVLSWDGGVETRNPDDETARVGDDVYVDVPNERRWIGEIVNVYQYPAEEADIRHSMGGSNKVERVELRYVTLRGKRRIAQAMADRRDRLREANRNRRPGRHRNPCDAEPNPAGIFTDKGERMYEEVKAGYGDDPRAAELAARTVYARARDGVSGLLRVGKGPPPGVPHGNPAGGLVHDDHGWTYKDKG